MYYSFLGPKKSERLFLINGFLIKKCTETIQTVLKTRDHQQIEVITFGYNYSVLRYGKC